MEISDLVIGDIYQGILLETYVPERVSRPRVRPISELPNDVQVEFPRQLRTTHPIGTRFIADVKVCQKHLSNGK